jgi:branched-chain amino acid transport system permease protein
MDWDLIVGTTARAFVGVQACYFALAAIGLNVHFGYTGLANFGQVAFVAVGAYAVAMGVVTFGWSLWLAIFMGLLAAVVLALILGIPTLRLRTDYLAIVTIAAGEIIRLTLRAASYRETTGGSDGLQAFGSDFYRLNPLEPGRYGFGVFRFNERVTWVLLVGWVLVGLASLLVFLLMRSPWGRVIKAIREDEDAVRSLGKNVYFYKMQSLILGGVIGALGGFIFALAAQAVVPDQYSTQLTFFAYTALILGGTARIFGPIVGSMLFWSLLSFTDVTLRQAVANDVIPGDFLTGTRVGILRFILVGLGLILLMVFRPQGIFGDKKEVAIGERG